MIFLADEFLFRFLERDFAAAATGVLAAVACGIIGSFLVLRRMSLMGDAISHAVLPGLLAAFLLTDSLAALPMFIGAAAVGVLTTAATETIHRVGRVESSASMGVVFTVLFAIGVIWMERIGGRSIHLDADCILYGNMQNVIWPSAPSSAAALFSFETTGNLPRQVQTLGLVLLVNIVFIAALFKELRITSFDPALAAAQGFRPNLMHYLLMTMMAITTVASFEAAGSILVVAMLIVPGVCARLLTDRLGALVVIAGLVAFIAAAGGYATAAALGLDATGTIGVMLGAALVIVGLLSPKYGWFVRLGRRLRMSVTILREDMLAAMYRLEEAIKGEPSPVTSVGGLQQQALLAAVGGGLAARLALQRLRATGEARLGGEDRLVRLTDLGRQRAQRLVRSHRLWETYLVEKLGLRPDHVHGAAMRLEHVTDPDMRQMLAERVGDEKRDPHGRDIPSDQNGPATAS